MSKGGCLWMSSPPPPPLIPYPRLHTLYIVFHPSKFRPPPPTWMAGYGSGLCIELKWTFKSACTRHAVRDVTPTARGTWHEMLLQQHEARGTRFNSRGTRQRHAARGYEMILMGHHTKCTSRAAQHSSHTHGSSEGSLQNQTEGDTTIANNREIYILVIAFLRRLYDATRTNFTDLTLQIVIDCSRDGKWRMISFYLWHVS